MGWLSAITLVWLVGSVIGLSLGWYVLFVGCRELSARLDRLERNTRARNGLVDAWMKEQSRLNEKHSEVSEQQIEHNRLVAEALFGSPQALIDRERDRDRERGRVLPFEKPPPPGDDAA